MRRRRSSPNATANVWPVVADAFLALLAVVIVMASGRTPVDVTLETFKKEVQEELQSRFSSIVDSVEVHKYRIRLVFTAQSLSFETCNWDLPVEKRRELERLFEWLGDRQEFLRQISVEGHADKRWEGEGCRDVGPYSDNLQLSQNRARALYNVLVGLEPTARLGLTVLLAETGRVPVSDRLSYLQDMAIDGRLLVSGFGDRRPLDAENPAAPVNRRVEVLLALRESDRREERP